MEKNYINRRDFLKIFGTMVGAGALASCTQGGTVVVVSMQSQLLKDPITVHCSVKETARNNSRSCGH